jgi:phage FluMu protein Com
LEREHWPVLPASQIQGRDSDISPYVLKRFLQYDQVKTSPELASTPISDPEEGDSLNYIQAEEISSQYETGVLIHSQEVPSDWMFDDQLLLNQLTTSNTEDTEEPVSNFINLYQGCEEEECEANLTSQSEFIQDIKEVDFDKLNALTILNICEINKLFGIKKTVKWALPLCTTHHYPPSPNLENNPGEEKTVYKKGVKKLRTKRSNTIGSEETLSEWTSPEREPLEDNINILLILNNVGYSKLCRATFHIQSGNNELYKDYYIRFASASRAFTLVTNCLSWMKRYRDNPLSHIHGMVMHRAIQQTFQEVKTAIRKQRMNKDDYIEKDQVFYTHVREIEGVNGTHKWRVILSSNTYLSQALMRDYHTKHHSSGVGSQLFHMGLTWKILQARAYMEFLESNCPRCKRKRIKNFKLKMSYIPKEAMFIEEGQSLFQYSQMDLAGPFFAYPENKYKRPSKYWTLLLTDLQTNLAQLEYLENCGSQEILHAIQ